MLSKTQFGNTFETMIIVHLEEFYLDFGYESIKKSKKWRCLPR